MWQGYVIAAEDKDCDSPLGLHLGLSVGDGSWITEERQEEWNDRKHRYLPAKIAGGGLNNTFCKNERM